VLERLRTDRSLYFEEADQIERAAASATWRAWDRLPRWTGKRPASPPKIEAIPVWSAGDVSAARYVRGVFQVNTSRPAERPRFESAALAFHESVPGHHLQRSLGQSSSEPSIVTYLGGVTALSEGWALYAEGLAEEMGLYETDLELAGRWTMAALRASRLVVDTGLHDRGWSRTEAIAFLVAHTALSSESAAVEVERYLLWPGQALAYAVGESEIRRLRGIAEAELGDSFDLRSFHRVVLEGGDVPLPLLEERIGDWISESTR